MPRDASSVGEGVSGMQYESLTVEENGRGRRGGYYRGMSHQIGDVSIICHTEPEKCEMCGVVDGLRPYGPRGEKICFDCMLKNETAAKRQFKRTVLGETEQ